MKQELLHINIHIDRDIARKIRGLVDTMPGATLNSYIEILFEREIQAYEEEYGEIEGPQDTHFNAPKFTKSTR